MPYKNPFTLDLLHKAFNGYSHPDSEGQEIVYYALQRQNPTLVDVKHKKGEKSALITCPTCKRTTTVNYEIHKKYYKEWYCKRCGQRLALERPEEIVRCNEYPISPQEHALRTLEDEVQRLREENKRLREHNEQLLEALQTLHDEQNGPPLLKWEEDWRNAMTMTKEALRKGRE